MMNSSPAQARSGFAISPLMVIGVIFVALLVVEALLAARFWLQLATADASDGLTRFILDASHPLVAPFADAQATAQEEVGSFERKTLLAAMAYLVAGAGLIVLTILAGGLLTGNEALVRRHRRSSLQHFDHPLIDNTGARLLDTVSLALTPDQATRALKMMGLDQLDTQLFVIPASGGCIIAAFEGTTSEDGRPSLLGRIGSTREAMKVRRALREIETRFATHPVEVSSAT